MVVAATVPRLPRVDATGEVLDDRRKNGKPRPWKKHKEESLEIAEAFRLIGESRRADAMSECGTWLRFAECPNGHERKLNGANFCRERLCPMCTFRRALLVAFQVRLVGHTALIEQPELRFLFLTLTVPNVMGEKIGDAVSTLYAAFQRLWRVGDVRRGTLGYFRALEVKYSRKRRDYHPHLHVLVAVPPRYFGDLYITREQWLEFWQRAVPDPTITQVDVRTVKPARSGEDRLARAAAEVGKYTVTAKDLIQRHRRHTAEVLAHIHVGLNRRRLTQFGGLLGAVRKRLRIVDAERAGSDDLVGVGDDPNCHCSICQSKLVLHVYRWLDGEYVG